MIFNKNLMISTIQQYKIQIYKYLKNYIIKMNNKYEKLWLVLKIIYTFIVVVLLIGLIVVSFIMKGEWSILSMGFADIGVYGVVIFSFLFLQQIFSLLNNNWWIPKLVNKSNASPRTNIQVVGYREDPKLFRSCLTSLSTQEYSNMGQILVGIDGNEDKDMKMVQVFQNVFPQGVVVKLQKLFQEMSEQQRQAIRLITGQHKYVCLTQPHKGKRDIMYTCFHCHSDEAEFIALTDSDTMWNNDTLKSLVDVMVGHDVYRKQHNQNLSWWQCEVKQCGSVTGDVGIWNKENYISYLSALRYWFAFNVERACDSFFGVVNCVSGPLGLYKRTQLQQISEGWIKQQFMGDKCTFGDDRNLSNRILQLGLSIFYTPYSKCETDTPAQLLRWIPQQTRWCKSFYREFLYNVKSFYKHSVWMSVELVFQFVYPFFIIITLVWFVTYSINLLFVIFSFIIIMGTLRGMFGFFRTGKVQFFHYSMYVFLYILFLIPSKLWALVTLWNNEWGTSSRFIRYQNVLKAMHAVIWAIALVLYLIAFIIKFLAFDKMKIQVDTGIMALCCLVYTIILAIHWNLWGTYWLVPAVENDLEQRICKYKETNFKKKLELQMANQPQVQSDRHLWIQARCDNDNLELTQKNQPPERLQQIKSQSQH